MDNEASYTEEQVRTIAKLYWGQRMAAEASGTAEGDWYYAENLIREVGYPAALDAMEPSPKPEKQSDDGPYKL